MIDDPTETLGNHDDGVNKLNEFGAHGWEIVGVSKVGNSYSRLYLKRSIK